MTTQDCRSEPLAPGAITVEVSVGELIDKITILEIKRERIADPAKRENVLRELTCLAAAREKHVPTSERLDGLTAALREVNERLWEVEDALRECERRDEFGPRFVELARSVYHANDRRAALKRTINELLGSALVEEKSYGEYASGDAETEDAD
jgi:hypothetical protein